MHRNTARLVRAALITGALLAVPSAAEAATVSAQLGFLDIRAAAGETNNIRVFTESGELTVTDTVTIRAGAGCRSFEPRKVRCGVGSEFLNVDLGDGNDSTILQTQLVGTVNGGRGDDTFHAGVVPGGSEVSYLGGDVCFPTGCQTGIDTISYGGADRRVSVTQDRRSNDGRHLLDRDFIESDIERIIGSRFDDIVAGSGVANTILGADGDDHLNAGGGNDIFDEGGSENGSDTLVGAAGFDQVGYGLRAAAVRVSLDGRADDGADFGNERDNASADIESVFGSRSHDSIFGNEQDNDLRGGDGDDNISGLGGDDFIRGHAGRDRLRGSADGNDTLDVLDGVVDRGVTCLGGRDTVLADAADPVDADCESRSTGAVGKLSVKTAGRALRVAWSHHAHWSSLDDVTIRLRDGKRTVGRVVIDQETESVTAHGAVKLVRRAALEGSGKRMTARLRLRVARRLAGEPLAISVAARDDDGTRQRFAPAGQVKLGA
jgi:hemolysin type calcium-binding protein